MAELKSSAEQSVEEKQVEQDEIDNFNQNTDYDPRSAVDEEDPFSPHNLAIQQFITTARVLDVGYAILKHLDADVARDLLELHQAGHVLGTAPNFSGVFLTDEMNGDNLGEVNANAEEAGSEDDSFNT